jgi:hypothetical protein
LDLAALLVFIDNQTKSLIDVCVSGFLGRDVWRQRSVEFFEQQPGVGVGDRVPRIDSAPGEFFGGAKFPVSSTPRYPHSTYALAFGTTRTFRAQR